MLSGAVALAAGPTARADHPSIVFDSAVAGPITTIQAKTQPKGSFAVGFRIEQVRSDSFSDAELTNFSAQGIETHSTDSLLSTSLGLSYGLSDDLTLGVRLPYIKRTNIREAEDMGGVTEIAHEGTASGIGDLALLGKYRVIRSEKKGYDLSFLFGIKTPTGTTQRTNLEGRRFETEHQPGSGSWDSLIGLAAGTPVGPVSVDASLLYTLASKGTQETNLGDRLLYSVAASYRMGGESAHHHEHEQGVAHSHHAHDAWDLVLELNGEWQARQKIAGVEDPNSGGNLVYLSPGVRFISKDAWAATLAVGIPVMQNLNGIQHETRRRLIFGLGKGF